jgi:phosphoribosylaminoimidazole-succinocarboxamide synthase
MTDNAGALFESSIPGYPLIGRGKVRDIYSIDDEHLLIVTTDRLSAFDVVMPDPVPGKGEVLTQISLYWFRMMEEIIENQLTSRSIDEVIEDPLLREQLRRRSLVVKRLKPLPIEAVARGYLIGSGWKDYRESGEICGIPLPPGLRQAERLPETLFTPASKAEAGDHDENIAFEQVMWLRRTPCSVALSSPTPSSSSVWITKAACTLSTKCLRLTPRASGPSRNTKSA